MAEAILKDNSKMEYSANETGADVVGRISQGLLRNTVAVCVNGEISDLNAALPAEGCELVALTFADEEGKKVYRHTAAHIMAQAVKRLYPSAKLTIGPAIENGFYYDFDTDTTLNNEVCEKIEAEMKKIIKEALPIERFTLSREEAIALMEKNNEPYKVELIKELSEGEEISFYRQGEYTDLCRGPHLSKTSDVKAVKITNVTGAYWKGDANNKMLQRVYGTAFPKQSELDAYLVMIEEAKKRDHRKIGKELGLFMLADEGPGFPFFLPKGMVLKNTLIDYWREVHKRYGYVEVSSPMMLNKKLWERSGHWAHYKKNMYTTEIDGEQFAIKPMNCPGGMLIYGAEPHSYRDLPLRVGELGLVHRHELSGTLHGLFRVRCFTQDDAHIFMTREQMKDEIKNVVKLFDEVYSLFGLEYQIELSTMPEDHMGDIEVWQFAEETLKAAITEMGKDFILNEGDGAFYGPKLDFHLKDCIGRTWQCGTVQLDFQLPERFELDYVGEDGAKHRPVMIHRVVFGSIERFIGVITEHFAGAFPTWLSPVQAIVLPISEKHLEYANKIKELLVTANVRAELDDRNEKIGYKIREAQLKKIPYMIIVCDKEVEEEAVSVRSRKNGDLGSKKADEFIAEIKKEIETRIN